MSLPLFSWADWFRDGLLDWLLDGLSVRPIIYIFTHLILGHAVALLDFAFELVAAAVDLSEFVIGQLTPFLLDLVFRGFPVPFNLIPINSLTSKPALLRAQTT